MKRKKDDDLWWSCHVCKQMRPDSKISVHRRARTRGRVVIHENVRYCNDNPECQKGAMDVHFLSKDRS